MSLAWSNQPRESRERVTYSAATMRTLARWYARFYWYHCADLVLSFVAIELWLVTWSWLLITR